MIELDIPLRLIDFGRLLSSRHTGGYPLMSDIKEWLGEQSISCTVAAPWKEKSCVAKFDNAVDAFVFKLRWL
jgi:hypothetical protein